MKARFANPIVVRPIIGSVNKSTTQGWDRFQWSSVLDLRTNVLRISEYRRE